jgi:AcrR family transcriptional regulator
VAAASELVDELGASAFSMRLLAQRLDTSTATLYRHVTSKEELMAYIVDRAFADIAAAGKLDERRPRMWQDAALAASSQFYGVLSKRPNLLPLLVSRVPIGPNGLATREQSITMLVHYGFSPRLAARAYATLARYVIGFAIQQHAPDAPGPEDAAALNEYYRSLDPVAYPCTVAAAEALTEPLPEDEFVEGLTYIIDGIERARRRESFCLY